MRCREVKRLLPAYLDRELPQKKREAVEAHLTACELCTREAERISAMWAWIGDVGEIEPSLPLWPGVVHRIREEQLRREPRPRWAVNLAPVARVAAVAVVLALGVLAGRYLSTPSASPAVETAAVQQADADSEVYLRTFRLDLFDDLPATSVGGAYVILVSSQQ